MLQTLAAELSQVAEAQQALPALLASQREALVTEISDRTHLSADQTSNLLTDITPTESTDPSPTYASATASSSLISKIESALDLPSWQQLSQQVLKQVDLSEVEDLVYQQLPSFLQSEQSQSEQSENERNEDRERASKATGATTRTNRHSQSNSKKASVLLPVYKHRSAHV